MIIHKMICDNCGKEKDLTCQQFGGFDTWQDINMPTTNPYEREKKHFCCMDCIIEGWRKMQTGDQK